jgi:hypothetical protein
MTRAIRRSVCTFVAAVAVSLLAVYPRPGIGGEAKPDAARPAAFEPLGSGTWR